MSTQGDSFHASPPRTRPSVYYRDCAQSNPRGHRQRHCREENLHWIPIAFTALVFPLFFLTYGAVFVAEIVGDKLLYTTGVLATRYRTIPIMCGMVVAFMAKMGGAVLVGKAISTLPSL